MIIKLKDGTLIESSAINFARNLSTGDLKLYMACQETLIIPKSEVSDFMDNLNKVSAKDIEDRTMVMMKFMEAFQGQIGAMNEGIPVATLPMGEPNEVEFLSSMIRNYIKVVQVWAKNITALKKWKVAAEEHLQKLSEATDADLSYARELINTYDRMFDELYKGQ